MSIDELLKNRIKVITPFPGIQNFGYKVDDILVCSNMLFEEYAKYPHLFKKLEWWEDREEKDMPEYLKCEGVIRKFKQIHNIESQTIQLFDNEGEIEYEENVYNKLNGKGYEIYPIEYWKPSTQQDYETYLTTTQNKNT